VKRMPKKNVLKRNIKNNNFLFDFSSLEILLNKILIFINF